MRHIATAAAPLLLLALASCSEAPQEQPPGYSGRSGDAVASTTKITVEDPWVQLPAVQGRPGAAYFSFRVEGAPDELLSVSTPLAKGAAMHETRLEGGVSRMAPLAALPLEQGKPLGFAPGARHVMLTGIDPSVKPGGTVPLTLTFARAAPITVQAEARAFGESHGAH
jgi:copper(I)-binding protein